MFLVLNLLVAIHEIFEDILKGNIRAGEKSKESHKEDKEVLNHSAPVKGMITSCHVSITQTERTVELTRSNCSPESQCR